MWVRFQNGGNYDAVFDVQWNGGESARTGLVRQSGPGSDNTGSIELINCPPGSTCYARMFISGGPTKDSESSFVFPATPPPNLPVMGITCKGGIANPGFGDWYWTD